jgi:hypothetical protein
VKLCSVRSELLLTRQILTPIMSGIGVTVVAKSATQLIIPQMRVMVPSFRQVPSGEPTVQ